MSETSRAAQLHTYGPAPHPLAIKHYFRRLVDPRRRHRRLHRLLDLVVIAMCAVICGANNWQQIATFAQHKRAWLERFLHLPNGVPSHDTFERVFDRLDPVAFQACFQAWITAVCGALDIRHIAIDGKTLRHSGSADLGPLQVVSAWATANHLALGQVAVDDDSNEITAIPRLLELLDVEGALVTIDAIGCQKEIAGMIVDKGGDYLLTVKGNQPHLCEDIAQRFQEALADRAALDLHVTNERGHGREEKRCVAVIADLQGIRHADEWPELRVIGMCYSQRTVAGKMTEEVRFFIGSKQAKAKYYGKALRNHWRIENNLHWQLDVTFDEDGSRICKRRAAENFALLRRLALSLLKQHPDKKSIACKRLAAALDTDFLEEILAGTAKLGKA
jgi:predicted transposase YbfD/YdcC